MFVSNPYSILISKTSLDLLPSPSLSPFSAYSLSISTTTMGGFCDHCQTSYEKSKSNHEQKCIKYLFSVHQHPLSKTGPLISIQRGSDNRVICQCLDQQNVVCTKRLLNYNTLFFHLRAVGHDNWKVSTIYSVSLQILTKYTRYLLLLLSLLSQKTLLPLPPQL